MAEIKQLAPYYMKLTGLVLMAGGGALMAEHFFKYEGFDYLDLAGHEYYGLIMIIIGFLLAIKWEQRKDIDWKKPRTWIR